MKEKSLFLILLISLLLNSNSIAEDQVVLEEDFSNGMPDWWRHPPDWWRDPPHWDVENGELSYDTPGLPYGVINIGTEKYSNFSIEFKVRILNYYNWAENWYSICVLLRKDGLKDDQYNSGYLVCWRYNYGLGGIEIADESYGGGANRLAFSYTKPPEAIFGEVTSTENPAAKFATFKIIVNDNIIKVYINDEFVTKYCGATKYTNGYISFVPYGAHVHFDDVRVTELSSLPNSGEEIPINFTLDRDYKKVSISIFNKNNDLVRELITGKPFSKGEHTVLWDRTDFCGDQLGPGEYTYKIAANNIDISYFTTVANTGNPPDEKGTIRGVGFVDVATDSAGNYYTLTGGGELGLILQKHNFLTHSVEWINQPSPINTFVYSGLCVSDNYVYVIGRTQLGDKFYDVIQRFNIQTGSFVFYPDKPGIQFGVIPINSYNNSDPEAKVQFPLTANGIACQGDKLYVANTAKNRIDIFDAVNGTKVGEISNILDPIDVALDAVGNIYVVSRSQKVVKKYSPEGYFIADIIKGLIYPYGVALDSDGDIYVTDQEDKQGNASNQIKIYSKEGGRRPKRVIGIPGGGTDHILPKKFKNLTGIAVDKTGKIFVADTGNNRVVKFDKHGKYLGQEYSEYTQAVWVDENEPFSVYTNAGGFIRRHLIDYWFGRTKYIDNWPFQLLKCDEVYSPPHCSKNIGRLYVFSSELQKIHLNNSDYLYVLDNGKVNIYKLQGHELKAVGAVGALLYLNNVFYAYSWIDYNGDEIAQNEELEKLEPGVEVPQSNVGFFVDKEGTIYLGMWPVQKVKKFILSGFYKDKPVYSINNTQDILVNKGDFVDIYVDNEGHYYVVELSGGFFGEHNNVSIRKYSNDEKLLWKIGIFKGSGEGQYIWPMNIISDGDFIYTNDRNLARIYMYTKDGLYLTSYGKRGLGLGESQDLDHFHAFKNPIDGNTYIFIADYGNNRVPVAVVTNKDEIKIITGSINIQ